VLDFATRIFVPGGWTSMARIDVTESRRSARLYRWLALLPTLGMLGGVPLANREHPYVLGMPLLLAWIVGWVLMTSAFMGLIFALDRRRDARSTAGAMRTSREGIVNATSAE
jgi:hypothetical protein